MCGINVIIDKTNQLDEQPILLMNKALAHRGPDAQDWKKFTFSDQQIFLGHTRLSIIDAENNLANQPINSLNQRFWLVYNGEIYNYQELRIELETFGISFKTESDTEVLLEGLSLKGEMFLEKVNGMFAFVCLDTEIQKVLVGRDALGMKPLYSFENERYIIYSSSIQAIQKSGLVAMDFNSNSIFPYLRNKFAPNPQTFNKNIVEILPFQNGQKSYRNGGDQITQAHTRNEIVEQVDFSLKNSIQRHLISDKPVGLFLSGGVDSTLILSILKEMGHDKFPVFSITNRKKYSSHNELDMYGTFDTIYSRRAAQQFGAEYIELNVDDEILLQFDEMVASLDQPIADPAALLTFILSKAAKKYVSVALSGAGADEVFAGYNRHQAYYYYLKYWQNTPKWISTGILESIKFSRKLDVSFMGINQKLGHAEKFFTDITSNPISTFQNFTSLGFYPPLAGNQIDSKKHSNELNLNKALEFDRTNFLSQDVLAMTDQMSMAHSLEVRMPFLDKDLLDFVDQLPASLLLKFGRKWILNELLEKRNGKIYVQRRKEGFGIPLGKWIRRPKNAYLFENLNNPNHPIFQNLPYKRTQEIIKIHQQEKGDFSKEIWALLVLAKWMDQRL